ncbi:MAG: 4'-phosphopantetheinyl transferase superfamily protein [Oscillospiraceae bacterium]|nr:4'-phosphopantetheinyl transferase superfamily protein [Oscillospiraceae bacterium]
MVQVYGASCEKGTGHAAAHALLAAAWRRVTGAPPPPLARTAQGKPYFPGGALEFSLSHTRTAAVCALSGAAVGVDAETIRPLRPGIAARCLNAAELDWLSAQAAQETAFFRLWTAKEAWTKLLGTGLQGCPAAVDLREAVKDVRFQSRIWGNAVVTVCTRAPGPAAWLLPE